MSSVNAISCVSVESLDLAMLVVVHVVLGKMLHYRQLATMCSIHLHRRHEGNRAVVGCLVLLSVFENWG